MDIDPEPFEQDLVPEARYVLVFDKDAPPFEEHVNRLMNEAKRTGDYQYLTDEYYDDTLFGPPTNFMKKMAEDLVTIGMRLALANIANVDITAWAHNTAIEQIQQRRQEQIQTNDVEP